MTQFDNENIFKNFVYYATSHKATIKRIKKSK